MNFKKDKEYNILLPKLVNDFWYSDWSKTEKLMLDIVSWTKDKSYNSIELVENCVDRPSYYHFWQWRATAFHALWLPRESSILEIWWWCWAITRYLVENFSSVDSVEGSYNRAKIMATRCEWFDNHTIYCINLQDYQTDKKYDYVIVNWVLEYAPLYIEWSSPKESCSNFIAMCSNFLNSTWSIITTIENKIWLKYRWSHPEDHTWWYFDWINDYPQKITPITFSKKELTELYVDQWLKYTNFYYPYPDYKFPTTILSETASDYKNRLHNWIPTPFKFYSAAKKSHLFDDKLAIKTLSNSWILFEFSNSFMVISSKAEIKDNNRIAKRYSIHRKKEYQTITTLYTEKEVEKKRIHWDKKSIHTELNWTNLVHSVYTSSFIKWDSIVYALRKMRTFWSKNDFIIEIEKYSERLKVTYWTWKTDTDWYELLKWLAFDAIPSNIISDEAWKWHLIDLERSIMEDIPIDLVLYRALKYDILPSWDFMKTIFWKIFIKHYMKWLKIRTSNKKINDTVNSMIHNKINAWKLLNKVSLNKYIKSKSKMIYLFIKRIQNTVTW